MFGPSFTAKACAGAAFGRKLRAHKVTSAGLDDYVSRLVTAYLSQRNAGESFASWVGRSDDDVLRGAEEELPVP